MSTLAKRTSTPVAALAIARLVLHQLVTRSRLIALGALGVLVAGLGAATRASDNEAEAATHLIAGLGLSVVAPVATLVVASAALGEMRDDKTLVYLWLRPISRLSIAAGAVLASLAVALPMVVLPVVASAVLSGVGELIGASALAASMAVVAYTGLFVAVGMRVGRPFIWGLAYILVWEGFISLAGDGTARLSIRSYTWSILHRGTDVDLDLSTYRSATASVLVPVLILIAGTALTTRWLIRREID
jgi:ABC-2 type transport system permease protein